MEKIYMEEHNQNQRQKKNHMLGFSVVLSFSVAIFAVFSLVSFGLAAFTNHGGVSYAAPVVGDTFTFTTGKDAQNNILLVRMDVSSQPHRDDAYTVPLYWADGNENNPVFCVEHSANVSEQDVTYKKGSVIDDYGLLYLLNKSFANGQKVTDAAGDNAKYVEAWVTQTAIWMYLYNANDTESSPNYIKPNTVDNIKHTTSLQLFRGGDATEIYNGENLYDKYVAPLVEEAKDASAAKQLSVIIDSNNPASVAEDKSFYESPVVTVSDAPFGGLTTFDVSVSGVEGAYLVDEDGNSLSTSLPAGTKFKVRIPANKINGSETVNVTVNVLGHFNTLTGNYYVDANNTLQKVVTVTGDTSNYSSGASFQIIPTPATGMNVAQTIYFIGLIVLLCGVGIVYANAKPVENKQ